MKSQIGNMTRTEIINKFIKTRGFKKYLEIGVFDGRNFNSIQTDFKVGIDPSRGSKATIFMPSDDYFALADEKFDIVFIDGLHLCEQVYKDIVNSLEHLNSGGVIVLHDLLPPTEAHQGRVFRSGAWNGDCWKAFVKYRHDSEHLCYVISQDEGCGVIDTSKPNETDNSHLPTDMDVMTYADFCKNREAWMNVKSDIVS